MEVTPLEFYEAIKDDTDTRVQQVRLIADSIRMQTLWLVNIQLPRNKKIRNAKKLWQFPWDDEGRKAVQNFDEMKQVLKRIAVETKGAKSRGKRETSLGYSAHKYKR